MSRLATIALISFLWYLPSTLVLGSEVDTTKAVIHHTASPAWTTVNDINKWHKERGWDGIGYHIVIYADGSVHSGRSINKRGAHARGRNGKLGIALVGYDRFNTRQRASLKRVLKRYKVQNIEKHHGKCPGNGLDLNEFRK